MQRTTWLLIACYEGLGLAGMTSPTPVRYHLGQVVVWRRWRRRHFIVTPFALLQRIGAVQSAATARRTNCGNNYKVETHPWN
ncbi:hypothetical protein B0H67DRAFT_577264 [Lasiosphaeris hirsuta]|uniref:Secreted protein n=1 Tax=Lasiosphaeris hirsuta TaxID=260670 RepID=A0AA40DY52_9PEZI|nr:hypothetical protein B0H67DRAFT_577264 [Lasiosphaeris hirsuta]